MTPDDLRDRLRAEPDRAALLFDFDGTLSAIVDDPAAAGPVDGAVELLDRLAGRYRTVAVVSGRPRAFLTSVLGPQVDLSGLYGLETRIDGVEADHAEALRWRPIVASVAARARLPAGVVVESKGLSLTIHFRQAPDAEPVVLEWADDVASETGLEVRSAKASFELHPPVPVDKGTSVRALAAGCAIAVYVGDDVGDLPAFAALDSLAAEGLWVAKVAAGGDELPEAVASAADLVVDGPGDVVELFAPLA